MANKSQSFWRIQSVMIINRYTDCWDDRCARLLHFYGPFNVVFIYKHCRVPCIFPSQPFTDQKRVRLSIGSGFGKNFSKMNTTGREIFGRKTRNRSWMSVRWWGVALASQAVKSLVFWLFHSKKKYDQNGSRPLHRANRLAFVSLNRQEDGDRVVDHAGAPNAIRHGQRCRSRIHIMS